jgi:hypothetical protein
VPVLDYRGNPMRLTLQDSTDEGMYDAYCCKPGTDAHEDVMIPDEASEGLISVAPLKVTGAAGSPINPIYVS